MTDEKQPNAMEPLAGDEYVLEDTGETLDDFQFDDQLDASNESPVTAASQANPAAEAVGEEALREEIRSLKDQYLRKLADFDNFRKRSEREKVDYFRHALADVVREILPVIDNFERALASPGDAGEDFRRGVELIYKQLAEVLQKSGVRAVGEAAEHFDPTIHEAVLREETSEVPPHTVMDVLQKGYFLNDRLIRPAMVRVSVEPPTPVDEEGGSS
ncbi:MAG TPA: nucleotide exchange factor GrpE [Thermoanaerobaculia bacterium]|nr:nucleotide exchange factor GrpE [Thermoanaerobaculia bacterium]